MNSKNVSLKVKKLVKEAKLPKYATDGSNGLDLSCTAVVIKPEYVEIRTGITVEIPEGYVGILCARSSVSNKNMVLANGIGVIDSDYRGEICLRFKVLEDRAAGVFKYSQIYKEGEKCGQLLIMPLPKVNVVEVDELEETDRGSGGFGSTDKN